MLGLDFYGGKDLLKLTLTHIELHLSVERDNLLVLVPCLPFISYLG